MILPLNSHIRNPPTILLPKQVVSFNAIRYSLDICQLSHERLIKKLSEQTENKDIEPLDFPEIFSDVWSIVNNAQMFGKIICREFGISKTEPKLSEIIKAIDFRNSNQHFEERISQVLSVEDLPVYGFLSWRKNYLGTDEIILSTIYSGTFTNKSNVSMSISNETQTESNEIIQKIEFSNVVREKDKSGKWEFNERKISVSKLISDLKSWIDHFDEQINEQIDKMENLEKHTSDLIIQIKGKLI
ncbi:hypothetical protein PG913_08510 [Tenacibaculum pacificus]|uniref:hypothetical protein n=1 Tax=Tenacibaculum pacificus TaxID=3018314 RepID=UPI0022F3A8C2|nr:hypothetical protein [Tenacibaculum pacificus]WBX72942.1 hypothetical protein PG913_08510 [Tenacibaculum pacificus]